MTDDAQIPVGVEPVAWRWRHISRSTRWFHSGDGDGLAEDVHEFEPLYSAADMARITGERDDAVYRALRAEETNVEPGVLDHWMARAEAAEKEAAALREALTPSGDTKAAYLGEFKIEMEIQNPEWVGDDDEPETLTQSITVPWDTIKEIMAAIRARAALNPKD